MRILLFIVVMILSVGSCYTMGQAFAYPDYGFWIFGGGVLMSTLAFALASRWNRA
ncbi:MAG: hypothetical protein RLZZ52_1066 [Actinomycetota bacterium]|jgi:hypothetical protein